jgi:uncharacterized protein (DUF433 family)
MNALAKPDLLESGIYTLSEAARLLAVPIEKVRVWVNGRGDRQAPLIENQLGRAGHTYLISFTNLMELRFIAKFAGADVSLREIRAVMSEAEDLLKRPHAFATNTVFTTDGKSVFARIKRKTGEEDVLHLKSKNYEFLAIIADTLRDDVIFDARGEAMAWFPRQAIAPNVVIHPRFSFGRPILRQSHVPTEAIVDSVKVEGEEGTADLFDVPIEQVREALEFHQELRKAV